MAFIGVILGCILLFFLIKTIGFKKYLIWSWNVAVSILSFIPGMGWIGRLLLIKDKATKDLIVKAGDEADQIHTDHLKNQVEEERRRQEEQEEARRRLEEEVANEAFRKYGRRDVQVDSSGENWKFSDEDWDDKRRIND